MTVRAALWGLPLLGFACVPAPTLGGSIAEATRAGVPLRADFEAEPAPAASLGPVTWGTCGPPKGPADKPKNDPSVRRPVAVFMPRCSYPGAASVDVGVVSASVSIDAQGWVTAVEVACESPLHQGFAQHAVGCLRRARFESSPSGAPQTMQFNLRFVR